MSKFSHLHVHTQFSLLDGAADIGTLYKKAVRDGMPALAITDHGNMFGAFKFVAEAAKHNTRDNPNTIKPIVGCEFYMVSNRHRQQFTREEKDVRYHQLLLAKNAEGYSNLIKLCSLGYIEGFYSKYPRIDKELLLQHHKGLIATSCCLGAILPKTILSKGEAAAEEELKWWLDLFGEDYYIELQRHGIPEQDRANQVLLGLAARHGVKVIASNDSHYVEQDDYNAHDILLCINTQAKKSEPTNKEFADDEVGARGGRFAFYNDQFFFKTTEQMKELFSDLPEAIDNTNEIVDKVEVLRLKQDILLPNFQVPAEFTSQDEYLHHLTFTGALRRYGQITPEIEERLNFELFTIKTMGFAGYFLIVADFIQAGRDIGVFIGPGRGSAAGSAVAYCIGITNIDPIKYNLLFERFLNPDRKSMPDIDTDFDDDGRQKVIDYVVQKYGRNQVAQIVTYGTMAAKMSIKDVSRVLELPLDDANSLAKLVPEKPGIELNRLIKSSIDELKEKEGLNADELELVRQLRDISSGDDLHAGVIREAMRLEGSVRNTGIHAAGIIIAPKDLKEIIPVATSRETDLLITQYDGKVIEDAGVIKMDFLGLKTLTIIRDTLEMIRQNHHVDIDIDNIPLDDSKTFEIYQRGETNGTFQFESVGMQKYLKDLKPDKLEDLIAMNALFRPGPLAYIPNFIARKHGREPVTYDLPEMQEYLEETYGITVYQEQVMLLSQKLAGFTKGEADTLRKAMGKKQKDVLDKMKGKFMEGCEKNGHDLKVCEKVWTDWEAFASYAFNKSHSTCYAFVAFQTGYLKAHYPAEYMAAVLTHNQANLEKVTFFMEECRRMGVPVLGPDVNESKLNFSVNSEGRIRFGLGAVKGVGEQAVMEIIQERENAGPFRSIFDLTSRVSGKSVNKRCLESMVAAGAFDCFKDAHRAQYFEKDPRDGLTGLEKAVRYGNAAALQANSLQGNLFGDMQTGEDVNVPTFVKCETWSRFEALGREKDVIGFYISGHPLDDFRFEISHFCSHQVEQLNQTANLKPLQGRELAFAGMITQANHRISKAGKPFGSFTIEDLSGKMEIALFGEDYAKLKQYLEADTLVFVKAKVQQRYNRDGEFEVKPFAIRYLSDVGESLVKELVMHLRLHHLDGKTAGQLQDVLSRHQGKTPLRIRILDDERRWQLPFVSKTFKVKVHNPLVEEINRLSGVNVTVG